jgi:hypothetical protein
MDHWSAQNHIGTLPLLPLTRAPAPAGALAAARAGATIPCLAPAPR